VTISGVKYNKHEDNTSEKFSLVLRSFCVTLRVFTENAQSHNLKENEQ